MSSKLWKEFLLLYYRLFEIYNIYNDAEEGASQLPFA